MIIPNDARRELYGLQIICERFNLSYVDHIWAKRVAENPPAQTKAFGQWPFVRAADLPANVTPMRKKAKGGT